jgi:hypothetical protein
MTTMRHRIGTLLRRLADRIDPAGVIRMLDGQRVYNPDGPVRVTTVGGGGGAGKHPDQDQRARPRDGVRG